MASSKKSSTSKTARVMNLLSKNREDMPVEQVTPPAPSPAPAPAPAPVASEAVGAAVLSAPPAPEPVAAVAPAPASAPVPHVPHTTPLISSMQADSAISHQVMSALESALNEELSTARQDTTTPPPVSTPPFTAPSAPPVAEPEPESIPAPVRETVPEPIPEPVAVSTEIPAAPAPEVIEEAPAVEVAAVPSTAAETVAVSITEEVPAPVQPSPAQPSPISNDTATVPHSQFAVDAETSYVNVMEILVEEKYNRYMDLFGVCKCQRCIADVKAYALNQLDPKYVVMYNGEVIPRITLYENQFSAALTAQILNACKIVMENPRHNLS